MRKREDSEERRMREMIMGTEGRPDSVVREKREHSSLLEDFEEYTLSWAV